MIPTQTIEKKRDGRSLEPGEFRAFLRAYLEDEIQDYHMAAFLMATYFRGLDDAETATLVEAMLKSGSVLDLSYLDGPRIDKHSTGGVGDKVSLVLAPLAAALGMYVPMMSGRGLGHTTGTLDKLESIPGFRTGLTLAEFENVLRRVGCAMIGQTAEIAPLDRRLYALRDVTATVPVIPLIAASIMSKKLAEGLTGLVLDVKVGSGAFIPEEDRALELARTMVAAGTGRGLPTVALLTAMDRPLGWAVGNALETREAIACLRGEGPPDLRELVLREVAEMMELAWPEGDDGLGRLRARAEAALDGGDALERMAGLVEAQGGDPTVLDDPSRLPAAPVVREVTAPRSGEVTALDPRPLGEGVVRLGGGRVRMDQEIDLAVGFELAVRPGDKVEEGRPLGRVHARDEDGAEAGARILEGAVTIAEVPNAAAAAGRGADDSDGPSGTVSAVALRPLVSHRVTVEGVEAF
ncbi:MAG: thymidine phosphorylase [Gemmatimonadota bacterium]